MLLDQRNYLPEYYNPGERMSFRDYLDEQTDNLLVFLRDAAENPRHPIRLRMDGAGEQEIQAKLQRWQNRQVHLFRLSLRLEHEQDRRQRLERKLRREQCQVIQTKDQLEGAQRELDQAKADLAVALNTAQSYLDQWRCRNCNAQRWD